MPTDTHEDATVTTTPSGAGGAPGPARRGPQRRRLLGTGAAVVAVALVVVGGLWLTRDDGTAPGSSTTAAPYDDPQSAGRITLCSADGTPVTGGGVDDTPFAAYAVGETGLPAEVDPAGAVATLFGYQPREGIGAVEFSGIPLTAAAEVADPARPAVPVGADVYSIGDFVTAFPATWDGFVQLRLYLGTPAVGTLTDRPYDTADVRVVGDRWELVDGGEADCGDAAPSAP